MPADTAPSRWLQLEAARSGFIRRCELYASYTLPKLCLPTNYKQDTDELSHDFQAVGAQSVNHLANKIMLAGFAPSRPFFRMDASMETQGQMQEVGVPTQEITDELAKAEKAAVRQLDSIAARPKLFEVIKNLIVIGNVLLCLEKGSLRVIGIKKYAVRRSASGRVIELMMIDKVLFDELEPSVQEAVLKQAKYKRDRSVTLYKWIRRAPDGDYIMEQWVDVYRLPTEFNGKWPEDELPYRALTWDLSDDAHYGTGLVEDYKGDFAALSALTKSQVIGAVLASEFRWLVNPAGLTKVEDLENSENGAVLPGNPADISIVESGKSRDLQVVMSMSDSYVTRIGRGFLLGTSVTRDAERVTAEEIRMQANELETSLGGAYSRLAVDLQLPLARWLLKTIGVNMQGSGFNLSVVTGLEALSRTGDLEDLKLWLADMAAVSQLPGGLQATLKMRYLANALAAPRRLDVRDFLKSDEELQAEAQAQQEAQQQQMLEQTGANVVENAAKQGQPTE